LSASTVVFERTSSARLSGGAYSAPTPQLRGSAVAVVAAAVVVAEAAVAEADRSSK